MATVERDVLINLRVSDARSSSTTRAASLRPTRGGGIARSSSRSHASRRERGEGPARPWRRIPGQKSSSSRKLCSTSSTESVSASLRRTRATRSTISACRSAGATPGARAGTFRRPLRLLTSRRAPKCHLRRHAQRSEHPKHQVGRDVLRVPIHDRRDPGARRARHRCHLSVGQSLLPSDLDDLRVQRATH